MQAVPARARSARPATAPWCSRIGVALQRELRSRRGARQLLGVWLLCQILVVPSLTAGTRCSLSSAGGANRRRAGGRVRSCLGGHAEARANTEHACTDAGTRDGLKLLVSPQAEATVGPIDAPLRVRLPP